MHAVFSAFKTSGGAQVGAAGAIWQTPDVMLYPLEHVVQPPLGLFAPLAHEQLLLNAVVPAIQVVPEQTYGVVLYVEPVKIDEYCAQVTTAGAGVLPLHVAQVPCE